MKPLLRATLVLIPLLLFASCHKQEGAGMHITHAEAKLVPAQAEALAGVNVTALKTTPLYQRHSNVLDLPLVEGAAANIGVDPRRDLASLLVAFAGNQPIAIAQGTFSKAAVQRKLTANGARASNYAQQTLYGSEQEAVGFPEDGLAVAGPTAALRAALDAREKGTGNVPSALEARLKLLDATDQIWFVSSGSLPVQSFAGASGIASTFSSLANFVNATAIGLHVDSGLRLTADLGCVSEHGAQQVRDAFRGIIGLARLTTKEGDLDLLKAYDAIQVSQERDVVHVRADLSPELSEKLLTRLPELRGSMGAIAR